MLKKYIAAKVSQSMKSLDEILDNFTMMNENNTAD